MLLALMVVVVEGPRVLLPPPLPVLLPPVPGFLVEEFPRSHGGGVAMDVLA